MMSRNKMRIIWIMTIIIVLCIPLSIFTIQDSFQLNRTQVWSNNEESHEIIRKHPIIATLYSSYYSNNALKFNTPEYNIKNNSYSINEKEKIKELQSLFNQEVNKMLKQQIIPHSFIELKKDEEFKADFGYLRDFTNDMSGDCYLTQYFRLHTDNDVSASYRYNRSSNKILSISIQNKSIKDLSQEELKTLGWNMICYLELDDIQDWEYAYSSFYSKKAKLVVYCYKDMVGSIETLNIGVELKDIFGYESDVIIEE